MEQRFSRSILLSVMLPIFLIRADFSVYICLNPYSILFQALISIKRYCLANEIGLSVLPTAFYMFCTSIITPKDFPRLLKITILLPFQNIPGFFSDGPPPRTVSDTGGSAY